MKPKAKVPLQKQPESKVWLIYVIPLTNFQNITNNESFINFKASILQASQNYFLKFIQTYSSVFVGVHHFHVRFYIISTWLIVLPHLPVGFFNYKWNLIFSEEPWGVFIEKFEESASNIDSFSGYDCQIFGWSYV